VGAMSRLFPLLVAVFLAAGVVVEGWTTPPSCFRHHLHLYQRNSPQQQDSIKLRPPLSSSFGRSTSSSALEQAASSSSSSSSSSTRSKTTSWFGRGSSSKTTTTTPTLSLEQRKLQLLQLGAALDRGQAYNPTSGEYYKDRMDVAVQMIDDFVAAATAKAVPTALEQIAGEWELVLSTVPHGIFRSSPFFLAIQESYETYAQEKESFGMKKADLFFKLHELQTCSWGVSKIGRVAQHIVVDNKNNTKSTTSSTGMLYSEFDTSIFSLTVIPILGWFKLLPTFGGCVVTAASCELQEAGELRMKVDYTTARKVPGLQGLGEWIWNVKVPVGAIWKLLPWNRGRDADCRVFVRYCDDDFRIVQDVSGDYFVYTRPVVPRSLDLAEEQPQE